MWKKGLSDIMRLMGDQFPTDGNSAKADFEVSPEPSGVGQEPVKFNAQEQKDAFLGGGGPKPAEPPKTQTEGQTDVHADVIRESLPPPGFVRLYRGEALGGRPMPGVSINQGRWFTNNLDNAQQFAKERVVFQGGTPQITYVDVAIKDAEQFFGKKHNVAALHGSYLLPSEVAAKKAVLEQSLRREAESEPKPPVVVTTETLPKPPASPVIETTPVQTVEAPKPEVEKTITTKVSRSFLERVGQRIKSLRLPKTS